MKHALLLAVALALPIVAAAQTLKPAQLPAAVRAKLASHYAAYKIREATTIVRADGSTVYEVEATQGGRLRMCSSPPTVPWLSN